MKETSRSPAPGSAVPYLVLAMAWFAVLLIASSVRTIEPVYLWVWSHGMLMEKLIPPAVGRWGGRLFLFVVYSCVGLLAWRLVERPARPAVGIWRRAALSWLGIEALFCLVSAGLVWAGLLYE